MASYDEYVRRGKSRWGRKFNQSGIAKKFIPAYNHGQRIRVKFSTGEVLSGRVGATTGWKPSLMLVLTSRSMGSSWLLSSKDRIVSDSTPIKRY